MNKVYIKVVLFYMDGLIFFLFINRLINFKWILCLGVLRLVKYKCFNFLDLNEIIMSFGFVIDFFEDCKGVNEGELY